MNYQEPEASEPSIRICPATKGRLSVCLLYTPERVATIKTVSGHRWHPTEKCWTVPHTDGMLVHLLALFAKEPVEVDPSLRAVKTPDNWEPMYSPELLQTGENDLKVRPNLKLLDHVRQAIQMRHYSYSTEKTYVNWIKRFILFHN